MARASRRKTSMSDTEWASLPLEIRMWAIDQARRIIGADPILMDGLDATARDVLLILTRRPVEPPEEYDDINRTPGWKTDRGL